ncbi:glycolate oxidase subunit GlcF [Agrobacterium vitis]|uniref:Glycolate oxidase iron-sulfur subunit n=1 Tax=Agrobacterium vitis TaxID=373 RepID=A0ABD6GDU8_AGRVI|nr:glycolate oxidase subunit GlcF [Agrobacterium vitis]MUO78460.1 glycolate oxidase subunit GlcF [Agrobacterium vitis]MUO95296.1 glycolate oxidase subunit GlcF [Agrobacterium vitis]MUP04871.1 glycolate oxidase subunit GlcF [Agrobacterium vitis]MUZ83750.1 glycolate oxidase subunit GlcF [Agrobacterium vitis]MVA09349.1 glycolate oxidase subunit GlcF [Agrobacterium vitis]
MQTNFTLAQLADPKTAEAESILRRCVHCGFCTATCPTYVTLGNELDSPRGRIYLIKDMLENGRAADEEIVTHIDRCLSCLACTTTCPSGVDYMHLVDHARNHIENTYQRPLVDRLIRTLLAAVLPYPGRMRVALAFSRFGRPFAPLMERVAALKPMAAMLRLAPQDVPYPSPISRPGLHSARGNRKGRVALLTGCAQSVLDPGINDATVALLTRLGIEVVVPKGEGCCGALVHHMGRETDALAAARRNIDAWMAEIGSGETSALDAIVITTSGCGTTIKDYGHMLRHDPVYSAKAARVSALAKDVSEYVAGLDLPQQADRGVTVAYHSACSLQHGQKVTALPKLLLKTAGFTVRDPAEGHLCCGSAGTYNILQQEISQQLKARKLRNIQAVNPDVIAAGNVGCMTQIGSGTDIPVVHTIELLNWAFGGEKPQKLKDL